jgi:hypothetical protein
MSNDWPKGRQKLFVISKRQRESNVTHFIRRCTKSHATSPIAQFKNVTLCGNCSAQQPVMDFESLAAAGAVESVESASYFPSGLRESAKRLLFLSPRQSPRRTGWVTFLNCAMIYLRVTF